jgi:hypothetical protein
MATRCFTPLLGKRLRAVALDECGNVPASGAANSMVVTNGFTTISLSAEVEDGSEIITRKADGSLCVNEMTASSFKRFTVEIEFCEVDPGLLAVTTNAEIYENYESVAAGIVVPEGTINKKFSLELWTGLSGEACAPGVEEASGYMLLPFVQAGVLGDLTVDGENAVTFSMTGAYTKGGNAWGAGRFFVMDDAGVPAVLPTPLDPLDHLLLVATDIAPPASACGLTPFMPQAAA